MLLHLNYRNFGNNIQRDKKFTSLFISLFLVNTTEDKILDFSAPSSGKVEIYGEVMVSLTATGESSPPKMIFPNF